ncbi:MAG: SDR family NAD(P)-dependent oxidoreductase [Clostridia bacterium]|nr:SDR family NAD(P)-dependent oxidoreductase [Clostridia bacterium]
MSRVAIVTGAGSGIGLSASKALARDGWTVYDFSRTDRAAPNVKHIGCDISDEAQVRAAVSRVVEEQGRIDLLLNNAGFGISGAVEFTRAEEAEKLIRVNLLGADNVTRAVLGTMRAQRGGRILFTSSIAGILPIPFQAWYSVTKAAINAYALALRNEVAPFGISVCAIMPGDIHTGFTAAREKSAAGNDVYGGRIEKAVSTMEKDERNGMSPDVAGAYLAKIAGKKRVKPLYAIGAQYKLFAVLAKLLPARLTNWILGRLYG